MTIVFRIIRRLPFGAPLLNCVFACCELHDSADKFRRLCDFHLEVSLFRGLHPQGIAVGGLALNQGTGNQRFNLALDQALHRPRAVHRVIAHLHQAVDRLRVKLQLQLAILEARAQAVELQVNNLPDLLTV